MAIPSIPSKLRLTPGNLMYWDWDRNRSSDIKESSAFTALILHSIAANKVAMILGSGLDECRINFSPYSSVEQWDALHYFLEHKLLLEHYEAL